MDWSVEGLESVQRELRGRLEDSLRALERRDEEAYRVGLADFHACLARWTHAQEEALLPAVLRSGVPGRDPRRELRLDCVQVRELARFLSEEVQRRAPLPDILGLAENLARRFAAHESEMKSVYFPAAAGFLAPEEWRALERAAPGDSTGNR